MQGCRMPLQPEIPACPQPWGHPHPRRPCPSIRGLSRTDASGVLQEGCFAAGCWGGGHAGTCLPLFLAKTTKVGFKSHHCSGRWRGHRPPVLAPSLVPVSAEPWSFPAGLNRSSGIPLPPPLAPSPLPCPCRGASRGVPSGGRLAGGAGHSPAGPGRCLCMPSTRALAVKAF